MTENQNTSMDQHGFTALERLEADERYWKHVGARFRASGNMDLLCAQLLSDSKKTSVANVILTSTSLALRDLTRLEVEAMGWLSEVSVNALRALSDEIDQETQAQIDSMESNMTRLAQTLDQRLAQALDALHSAVEGYDRETFGEKVKSATDYLQEFSDTTQMLASVAMGRGVPEPASSLGIDVKLKMVDVADDEMLASLPQPVQRFLRSIRDQKSE